MKWGGRGAWYLKMSLLHHNYERSSTWQSGEYSLCDRVWPPPPPSPSQKNPGHAPEEEKEIAELSKKESTRSVQRLSQQNKNRMVMTYRYICFNKKRMNQRMATKPFHEVCGLGNTLLFPWFKKQTNRNSNRGIPKFLKSILPWELFHLMLWVFLLYRIAGTGWNFSQSQWGPPIINHPASLGHPAYLAEISKFRAP